VKIALFDWLRSLWLRRLTINNSCSSATVIRVHDRVLVVVESDDYGPVDVNKVGGTGVC